MVWFRNPPYSRNAGSVNKFAKQFKIGDLVDQGDHIFWEQGRPGRFCNEEGTIFSADCTVIRNAVSPSAAEFAESLAQLPAMQEYAITDALTHLPIKGMQTIAPGITYNPSTGEFAQGGPVIPL